MNSPDSSMTGLQFQDTAGCVKITGIDRKIAMKPCRTRSVWLFLATGLSCRGGHIVLALSASLAWACGGDPGTDTGSMVTPTDVPNGPPHTQTRTPWHLVNVHLYAANESPDMRSYCTTFSITGNVPDNINVYIAPFNQRINGIPCYGGIQTRIDGSPDKIQRRPSFETRSRGAIFSRWEERHLDAIRQAPGGLVRSAGYEGDFISVRNDFRWRNGNYRLCLIRSDVVEGDPLPPSYSAADIAHSWGSVVHTWVRMEATDLSTKETTVVGALAFPGRTLSLREINTIFVEIYGHGGTVSARDVPEFNVSFSSFQVDGHDQDFVRIVEIANPHARHANDPVMAQTRYLDEGDVIRIEVGRYYGKKGRNVREFPVN